MSSPGSVVGLDGAGARRRNGKGPDEALASSGSLGGSLGANAFASLLVGMSSPSTHLKSWIVPFGAAALGAFGAAWLLDAAALSCRWLFALAALRFALPFAFLIALRASRFQRSVCSGLAVRLPPRVLLVMSLSRASSFRRVSGCITVSAV